MYFLATDKSEKYTLVQYEKDFIPIPSDFSKDMFTIAALDNFYNQDWWSPTDDLPLSKTCQRYPTMMKLGTVIPYLKKIHKMYKSRITAFELC